MTEEQQSAIDNLRSGNFELSTSVRDAVQKAVSKSAQLISELDDVNELLTAVKVLEVSTKMVGLTPKETQTNIQINAINGFDFIEIGEADVIQLRLEESFEDAEIE